MKYVPRFNGVVGCLLGIFLATGCAGYSKKTEAARAALNSGDTALALKNYNQALRVKKAGELPSKSKKNDALLVLDRAIVEQSLQDYKDSMTDLQYADKKVEILDLERNTGDEIAKYMFTDSVGPYQAPPYEKIMVNTMNLMNYLAAHQLSGAKVEARRFSIIQEYLNRGKKKTGAAMSAPGSYLAGFAFERDGRADIALKYYDQALAYGEFKTLVAPVRRLLRLSPASATPRLKELLAHHPLPESSAPSPSGDDPAADSDVTEHGGSESANAPGAQGTAASAADPSELTAADFLDKPTELLVIINYGRVPAKISKRIPIGLALTLGTLWLTPDMNATAGRLAAQGLVTWVNYPELEPKERPIRTPGVKINGAWQTLEGALNVTEQTRAAYDAQKGKIIAAAVTRMITRAAIGNGAAAAAKDSVVGTMISFGSQALLTAADTPDTRSWATLPGRIAFTRTQLQPGTHKIHLQAQGKSQDIEITLKKGEWRALVLTALN
ncbi:MAG: hypothetical protein MK135_10495 [Polyangiaceae bacterium]|nr:hypothetical protein [Polyangiaceae bacterium]